MLARDNFGYVHEIPTHQILMDGFGNPVGQLGDFFDFLKPVASALTAPLQMATAPLQAISGLVGNLLPHASAPAAPPPPVPVPAPMVAAPGAAPFPFRPPFMFPPGFPHPGMPHHEPPLGWIHPHLPYTGLGPQRLYMRCAVWPGPAGMVPGPSMPTGPWPGAGGPGAPGAPGAGGPGGGGFHHHRHHHRHR